MFRRPRLARTLGLAAAAIAALGAAGCERSGPPTAARPTTAPSTAASPPAPTSAPAPTGSATGGGKPVLRGLLDRDGEPPSTYVGTAVSGWVVNTTWRELQPQAGGPIAAHNAIDTAIAAVRELEAAHPGRQLGLKLRVRAGVDAPDWAKQLGGGAVTLTDPQSGRTDTIGRFWTDDFGRAYADLQRKLAAKYDNVPEVRETVVNRCTTFYAEPFIRGRGDRSNTAALLAAGFTTAADHRCLEQMIDEHAVWRRTNSDVAFNPYQDVEARGPAGRDEAFTESVMSYCRATLGARCVLENNSLANPPRYPEMYAHMQQLGPPLAFQTASARRIGDLAAVLQYAEQLGASSVELPVAYRQQPASAIAAVNSALTSK